MAYDLRVCELAEIAPLFAEHHGYKSTGNTATYALGVFEVGRPVAGFLWQPPPPGAASSVCAACPQGVLALSRMVAVPRAERELRHISKPLRRQMLRFIDRTRWPVLVTYSDEGQGHTGHVYKCSGWRATIRRKRVTITVNGARVSTYSNGAHRTPEGAERGTTWLQRWEHWVDAAPAELFAQHWRRVPVPGKVWRSGNQAYGFERLTAA